MRKAGRAPAQSHVIVIFGRFLCSTWWCVCWLFSFFYHCFSFRHLIIQILLNTSINMKFSIKVEDTGALVPTKAMPDGVVSGGRCVHGMCEVVSSGVVPVSGGAYTCCGCVGTSESSDGLRKVEGRSDVSSARRGAVVPPGVLLGGGVVPEDVGSGTGGTQILDFEKDDVSSGAMVHPALCDLSPLVGKGSGVMMLCNRTGEVHRCVLVRADYIDGLSECFVVDMDCRVGGVDLHGTEGRVGAGKCDARVLKPMKWVCGVDGSLDWGLMNLMLGSKFRRNSGRNSGSGPDSVILGSGVAGITFIKSGVFRQICFMSLCESAASHDPPTAKRA